MENKEVILYLPDEVEKYLSENDIDIKRYLWDNGIDIEMDYRYFGHKNDTSATRALRPVIIIAAGVSTFLVLSAINNLVTTVLDRPQIMQVEESKISTNDGITTIECTKKYELLEPKKINRETEISLDALKKVALKYRNKED